MVFTILGPSRNGDAPTVPAKGVIEHFGRCARVFEAGSVPRAARAGKIAPAIDEPRLAEIVKPGRRKPRSLPIGLAAGTPFMRGPRVGVRPLMAGMGCDTPLRHQVSKNGGLSYFDSSSTSTALMHA